MGHGRTVRRFRGGSVGLFGRLRRVLDTRCRHSFICSTTLAGSGTSHGAPVIRKGLR